MFDSLGVQARKLFFTLYAIFLVLLGRVLTDFYKLCIFASKNAPSATKKLHQKYGLLVNIDCQEKHAKRAWSRTFYSSLLRICCPSMAQQCAQDRLLYSGGHGGTLYDVLNSKTERACSET